MVTVSLLFGILMIFLLISILGGYAGWQGPWLQMSTVVIWILFALLGWKVFGPLIQ